MSDYDNMLAEFGLTEADMRKLAALPYNVVPVSQQSKITIGYSAIAGRGLFAATPIAPGEVISMAALGRDITPAGRYVNHADDPNAQMTPSRAGNLCQVALRAINPGEEVTNDYRHNAKAFYACVSGCGVETVTNEMVRHAMQAALARVQQLPQMPVMKRSIHEALHGSLQ